MVTLVYSYVPCFNFRYYAEDKLNRFDSHVQFSQVINFYEINRYLEESFTGYSSFHDLYIFTSIIYVSLSPQIFLNLTIFLLSPFCLYSGLILHGKPLFLQVHAQTASFNAASVTIKTNYLILSKGRNIQFQLEVIKYTFKSRVNGGTPAH